MTDDLFPGYHPRDVKVTKQLRELFDANPLPPDVSPYITPDSLAAPTTFAKTIGFPYPAHLPKRAKPRYVDENGWPIWRVSYVLPNGIRMMAMIGKPKRSWAQAWAARMGRDHGWTDIVIGRWQGGLSFAPTPR